MKVRQQQTMVATVVIIDSDSSEGGMPLLGIAFSSESDPPPQPQPVKESSSESGDSEDEFWEMLKHQAKAYMMNKSGTVTIPRGQFGTVKVPTKKKEEATCDDWTMEMIGLAPARAFGEVGGSGSGACDVANDTAAVAQAVAVTGKSMHCRACHKLVSLCQCLVCQPIKRTLTKKKHKMKQQHKLVKEQDPADLPCWEIPPEFMGEAWANELAEVDEKLHAAGIRPKK